jgi:hypothetical protein
MGVSSRYRRFEEILIVDPVEEIGALTTVNTSSFLEPE